MLEKKKNREFKEKIMMNKIVFSSIAIIALSITSLAGGKAMSPVNSEVVPIVPPVPVISPWPIYVGLGLLAVGIERDPCPCAPGDNIEDHRYGGIVRAGWDFNPYIGVEARALKTFGGTVFSETEHYGIYLKPQYHVTPQMNVYGLIGYGNTKIDYTNGVKSSTTDENGLSYGAGIEYDFTADISEGTYSRMFDGQGDQEKGWGVWVDVQHLLSNAGAVHTDSNIITAGITYDF